MVLYAPLSRLPRRCWFRRCALGFLPHLAEDLGEPDRSDEDGGGAAHADLVALEDPGGLQSLQICGDTHVRSEEHTSELQSRGHLVCRLLLEKKKKTQELPQHTTIG